MTASSSLRITCDRSEALLRVAVFCGKELIDLYVNKINQPCLVGSVVAGKVARIVPAQKMAFIDCALDELVCAPLKTDVTPGSFVLAEIKTAPRQGKAYGGEIIRADNALHDCVGIVTPAPHLWQIALTDHADDKIASLTFECAEDYKAAQDDLADMPLIDVLEPLAKERVHPELDEMIDSLLQPVVNFAGGQLVIEPTEALVAIDVNGVGNALSVNMLAVKEAARQIRLRNLSGAIVIDCLKMAQRTDANKLIGAMEQASDNDSAGIDIFGLTKLGMLELTRMRRWPSLAEMMCE